ncbi:histidine phosphatase family protein [Patescibacteria group bacterium]|nr:histidine phosphatase family protein [Patescibacteria group bacterium]
MKKFYVRKTIKYDPTFGRQFSRYDGYKFIALKKEDPDIEGCLIDVPPMGIKKIFHSTQKRGIETAQMFSKDLKVKNLTALKELKEITFDLGNLLNEKEFNKFGSNLVRKRFIEAFVNDTLMESRKKIRKRTDDLLEKLSKLNGGNYLIISHSFLMKLLHVYLLDQNLFDCPEILSKYFDTTKKTFEFGCGFEFSL